MTRSQKVATACGMAAASLLVGLALGGIQYLMRRGRQATLPPGACAARPSGLVSWWPGAGNADDIIGKHNGLPPLGTTFVPGKVGTAFGFDGVNDGIIVPRFGTVIPGTEITIEFWQNVNSVRAQYNLCLQPIDPENIFTIAGPWHDGKFTFEFGNLSMGGGLGYRPPNSIIGSWQHFACVASQTGNLSGQPPGSGYMKIYRNGVLEAWKVGMRPFVRGDYDLILGADAGHAFDGLLDEVSIYNRALSDAEIAAIYKAGAAGKCVSP